VEVRTVVGRTVAGADMRKVVSRVRTVVDIHRAAEDTGNADHNGYTGKEEVDRRMVACRTGTHSMEGTGQQAEVDRQDMEVGADGLRVWLEVRVGLAVEAPGQKEQKPQRQPY